MGLNKWDVGIAYVRFEDVDDGKVRPVLVVNTKDNSLMSFIITTRFRNHILEYPIKQWREAGLDKPSYVRLRRKVYFSDMSLVHKIGILQKVDIECIEKLCQNNNISLIESWWDYKPTFLDILGTDTLYHATYKPYWEEIKKSGRIKPGMHSNWEGLSHSDAIYLSKDYNNAYSYAETAESAPKEYLDQIVVLEIDANKLDINKLHIDENQAYWNYDEVNIEDPSTWVELQYEGEIPLNTIKKVHDLRHNKLKKSTLEELNMIDLNKLLDILNSGKYDENFILDNLEGIKKISSKIDKETESILTKKISDIMIKYIPMDSNLDENGCSIFTKKDLEEDWVY